jgi:hypothetical protein
LINDPMEAAPAHPNAHTHGINVWRPTLYRYLAPNARHAGYSLNLDEPIRNFGDLLSKEVYNSFGFISGQ